TAHVLHADLAFHRDRTPGELLTRCDGDVTSLTTFLAGVVARIVGIVLVAVASVIVLAFVEPRLAPVLAVGYSLLGWTMWRVRDLSADAVVAERTVDAEMSSVAEQYLAGADDVAALGAGAHGLARFADRAARLVDAVQERVRYEMRTQGAIKSVALACMIAVLAIGGLGLTQGWVEVAGVVLAFQMVQIVRRPVEHLTWRLMESQGVAGAARRIIELVDERRQVVAGTGLLSPGPLDLRFVGTSLVYDDAVDGVAALSPLHLDIPAGRVIGLVGRTGSGKTTVARLVLRLVAPTGGQLLVGGADITGLEDRTFRRRVGAIPQDVQLFPGSVRDNVAMFDEVDDVDVERALRDAGLDAWFDALPAGLDTLLAADSRMDQRADDGVARRSLGRTGSAPRHRTRLAPCARRRGARRSDLAGRSRNAGGDLRGAGSTRRRPDRADHRPPARDARRVRRHRRARRRQPRGVREPDRARCRSLDPLRPPTRRRRRRRGARMRLHGERRLLRAANFRARWYWLGTLGWIAYFVSPIVPGWLIGAVFDELQANGPGRRATTLIVALALAELASIWGIAVAHRTYMRGLESSKALLRSNVIDAQLASGGPRAGARIVPVGDILVRLRDDPFDMMFLLDNWVDLVGALLYSSTAAYFLIRIDPWAAFAGITPLILVGLGNRFIANIARRYRTKARVASSEVSDFLAATFEASLTVKVAGAQAPVLRRLDRLNAKRLSTAVGDGTWNEVIWTINSTLADAFVGVAIVVAARGPLTAGEVTLFFAYLGGMTWLPMRLGGLIAGRRRYEVSAERMDALLAPAGSDAVSGLPDPLVAHRPMPVLGGPSVPAPVRPRREPLERLELRGLTVEGRNLRDIDLTIERGQLVVVSGPVGSGKSSLLRAVIGLMELDAGTVSWNGRVIEDRAEFFVPPQCSYVAQVPRLFAEPLLDNLRLGHRLSDDDVLAGIALAAFEDDVAALPEGLGTLVGARGVRLSGGQVQRAAGARALAHRPELLVLDDLTSALDVATELVLWERLAAAGFTVLAASNRSVALQRADRVLRLG
ncbi:MAG: ABC transporter ATP-binding protein, partial [Ilumatobacteraceae bacterium]